MKKWIAYTLTLTILLVFGLFALGSSESDGSGAESVAEQSKGSVDNTDLGDYQVEIKSCRMAKSYDDKPVVIVTYSFTNNSEEAAAFYLTFEDQVYQNGIGLNKAYVLDDSANYSGDNQTKEIKTGATLDVDVAYELNDTTTDLEVEVKELSLFGDDKIVKRTFEITE